MKYTKPPLSVDDQIALFRQRDMVFDDVASARHSLAHINYYRLRAYWLPFEVLAGEQLTAAMRLRPGHASRRCWLITRSTSASRDKECDGISRRVAIDTGLGESAGVACE